MCKPSAVGGGQNCLVILNQNVCFASKKKAMIEVEVSKINPDIICLTETALWGYELENFKINGYNLIAAHCRSETVNRGGGVSLFISNELVGCSSCISVRNFTFDKIIEMAACRLNIKGAVFIVVGIYRPPRHSNEYYDIFFVNLRKLCMEISSQSPSATLILCGDFNICQNRNTIARERLNNLMLEFNLNVTSTEVTRLTHHSASSLDSFFTNYPSYKYKCRILKTVISDHYGVELKLRLAVDQKGNRYILKRECRMKNKNEFSMLLKRVSWELLYQNITSANVSYDLFDSQLQNCINVACPFRLCRIENKKINLKLDNSTIELRQSVRHCDEMYKLTGSEEAKLNLTNAQNAYKNKLKLSKILSNSDFLKNSDNLGKASWQVINASRKLKKEPKKEIKIDNCANVEEVSNTLNSFFISKPKLIHDQVAQFLCDTYSNNVPNFNITEKVITNSFFLFPCTPSEIESIVRSLKSSNTAGPDGTSSSLLKSEIKTFSAPISHLVNVSFNEGVFPSKLKISKIIPLYKKGSQTDPNNYRPLAITSAISKIFEKAFYNRVIKFLTKHSVLSERQFGFLKNRTTMQALLDTTRHILNNFDKKISTAACFLDLTAAFDCVQHGLLLKKLENYGIRGNALNWIKTFLTDRIQYVEVTSNLNNDSYLYDIDGFYFLKGLLQGLPAGNVQGVIKSKINTVNCGVPQGSVLGPLLYLLYVNSILFNNPVNVSSINYVATDSKPDKLTMYADDTSALFDNICAAEAVNKAQFHVQRLKVIFAQHGLHMNDSKTNFIVFSNNPGADLLELKIYDNVVKQADSVNFLGVNIDRQMKWHEHELELRKKLLRNTFVLKELTRTCQRSIVMQAYHSLFMSHIAYSILLWGHDRAKLEGVFKIQKRVVRSIKGLKYRESCRDAFPELDIMTIPAFYIFKCLTLIKGLHSENRINTVGLNHGHDTRNRLRLATETHRIKQFEGHPLYTGVKFFNYLPPTIVVLSSKLFVKKMRNVLTKNVIYTFDDYFNLSNLNFAL